MKIVVYNFKGGVGKSTIALNYALTQDFGVVTNDVFNRVDRVLPEGRGVRLKPDQDMPKFPADFDVIFDLGGYLDKRAIAAMKQADVVIHPTIADPSELEISVASLKEISSYHKNIIVVVNKAEKGDDELVEDILKGQGITYKVLPLKATKALKKIRQHKTPLRDLITKNGLNKYVYGPAAEQFEAIIEFCEEKK